MTTRTVADVLIHADGMGWREVEATRDDLVWLGQRLLGPGDLINTARGHREGVRSRISAGAGGSLGGGEEHRVEGRFVYWRRGDRMARTSLMDVIDCAATYGSPALLEDLAATHQAWLGCVEPLAWSYRRPVEGTPEYERMQQMREQWHVHHARMYELRDQWWQETPTGQGELF
jgi:hypothetical protein